MSTNVLEQRKAKPILGFHGDNRFLSNFFISPCEFEGLTFPHSEGAFQAAKTTDIEERKKFLRLDPPQTKRQGRLVDLRPDWQQVKVDVMRACLLSKFTLSPELMKKLKATGDAYLEETNTWGDEVWGVCDGKGENLLGKLLMNLRDTYYDVL